MREVSLFFVILLAVLVVNLPLLSFNLLYPEQPLLYVANQTIHSLGDLFRLYWQPKMLHFNIPFFRPSGHFLIYQLLIPLLGWHNTKGLLLLNLVFLALSGYLLIKLYRLFFPAFKIGGYLAFGLYLMHPALILSRLISLHFEFAYVFFILLSLYCFMVFCEKNIKEGRVENKLKNSALLAASLFFYLLALTFKEAALMLGPVLLIYLLLVCHNKTSAFALLRQKQLRQIALLLMVLSSVSALYLTLPWMRFTHPLGSAIQSETMIAALKELLKSLFGMQPYLYSTIHSIQGVANLECRYILGIFTALMVICTGMVFLGKEDSEKRSLKFLYAAALSFMILPISWAMGLPWHLSPTLLFLSLLMGFSCEYLLQKLTKNKKWLRAEAVLITIALGLSALLVNLSNINYLLTEKGLELSLRYNALMHPPQIQSELNAESVIVVEDSILRDPYRLGNSAYPYPFPIPLLRKQSGASADLDTFLRLQKLFFIKYDFQYNGSLFKWAYLLPDLQEEEYPFTVAEMEIVPDSVLHSWLQHYDNIFCLGYDGQGSWHDRTQSFKKKLLEEKKRRGLVANQYELLPATAMSGSVFSSKSLPLPDNHLCQVECDQNKSCQGFVYESSDFLNHARATCQFFNYLSLNENQFCASCIGFIKNKEPGA